MRGISSAPSRRFFALKIPRTRNRDEALSLHMERLHMLDMVARIRVAANDCERLILAQKETLRSLRMSGKTDGEEETKLSRLESQFDQHMAEMELLLNELDEIA
jgi:hypothetical protein